MNDKLKADVSLMFSRSDAMIRQMKMCLAHLRFSLSVLSGRDLYEYKQDLFKDKEDNDDDSGGGDNIEEDAINNDDSKPAAITEENVEQVAEQVQSDLLLEGDDEDLDDLMDD